MILQRVSTEPVFRPEPTSWWENVNVFNPAVIHDRGLFHMLYRARGADWISRLGYAVSPDGVRWNRLREPVLVPEGPYESRGVEDPRLVKLEERYVMTYTAYGGTWDGPGAPTHAGGGIRPMVAVSDNLLTWERLGPITVGEDNKDHVLFPRKVGGRYAALMRRWPDVWLAYSEDLRRWPEEAMVRLYGPRAGAWDGKSVGSNGVPVETPAGWLLLNHGYDADHVYRFGVVLLDRHDPARILSRPRQAIFEPRELWELRGDVPNVVFSCANPVVDGTVYVFYGGGDHVIGLATAPLEALLAFAAGG